MAKRKGNKKKAKAPLPRDCLSLLPPELLSKILALVPISELPKGAVSKSLHPLLLDRLYQKPVLTSYNSLDKLCRTVSNNLEHGELIRGLSVEIPFAKDAEEPGKVSKEQTAPPTIASQKDIGDLFRTMKRTMSLWIEGSTRLAMVLLSPQVASEALPSLGTLFVRSTLGTYKDPFSPSSYSNLAYYEALEDIAIVVERPGRLILPSEKPPLDNPPLLFNSLARLLIDGPLIKSPAATSLLRSFGEIFYLSLGDEESVDSPVPLLSSLDELNILCHLCITSSPSPPYDPALEDAVRRLKELEVLELGGGCTSVSPAFYDALRDVPNLKHLTLGMDAPSSTDELAALIGGSRKHPSLERLTLDVVWGKMGTRIEEDMHGDFYDPGDGPGMWGVYPDWIPPHFTDTFTRDGLQSLVRLAEQVGFKLDGDALAAIAIDEAFVEELDTVTCFEMAAEEVWHEMG